MVLINHHVILVAYPVQGHLNPALRFAKKLLGLGTKVTFATILHSLERSSDIPVGLNIVDIPNVPKGFDANHLNALRKNGSEAIRNVFKESSRNGCCPVTLVVYTTLLSWAGELGREMHVPSALLWTQPATVLGIYYHYFHGYEDDINNFGNDPFWSIQLPGLPLFSSCELPSNIIPPSSLDTKHDLLLEMFKIQFHQLDVNQEEKSLVFVNTFDALEVEALKAIGKYYNLFAIGPLVISSFNPKKTFILQE